MSNIGPAPVEQLHSITDFERVIDARIRLYVHSWNGRQLLAIGRFRGVTTRYLDRRPDGWTAHFDGFALDIDFPVGHQLRYEAERIEG